MDRRQPPIPVDISDDEISGFSPTPLPTKRPRTGGGGERGAPPTFLVIDDDPTPQKPNPDSDPSRTPSFVAETPLSADVSVVKCSVADPRGSSSGPQKLPDKFAGIAGCICLESDDESEDGFCKRNDESPWGGPVKFGLVRCSKRYSVLSRSPSPIGRPSEPGYKGLCSPTQQAASTSNKDSAEIISRTLTNGSFHGCCGSAGSAKRMVDSSSYDRTVEDAIPLERSHDDEDGSIVGKFDTTSELKGKHVSSNSDKNKRKNEVAERKKQQKEEKARIAEERKRKRQEEKLQKEALKAEAAERKKLEKEKQKWEKGKHAIKSIVAEIDAKVVENGSVGGHLLTRFAEKGLSFRITSNPIERSILWQMSVPDEIAQVSVVGSEVPYVLLIYQAEEFCELVNNESLFDHVHRVQSHYPSSTICYLTNKLMSYINKRGQNQYKNPTNTNSWRRPPVEEALSKLATHFTKVHSRQCIDEAELAEHVIGLTSSLASCQFRKKLTQLSVNARIIPKDITDRNIINKNVWLKALVAIPKVQPRYAIAIWKRYPTMRSLLNVYMDPNKSVHEKEFLLKDLMLEGLLGKEHRRLGEICSKRVYRILMAQSGGMKTDDAEDGADAFGH